MKSILLTVILTATVSFIFSCQKHSVYNPELLQVEKQIEQSPDSALLWLKQNIPPKESSKADLALYYLLFTSAKDKMYAVHTSDSLISFAANYFTAENDLKRSATAWYYMGRINHDLQKAPMAQGYYLKALNIALELKDYKLACKICNNLGGLYTIQLAFDSATRILKRAAEYHILMQDTATLPYVYRNIARAFDLRGESDSAIYYYEKGLAVSDSARYYHILSELCGTYVNARDVEKAYDAAIKFIANAKGEYPEYPACMNLGKVYWSVGKFDSARYYLNRSKESPKFLTKLGSYFYLAKVENEAHNYRQYAIYQNQYEKYNEEYEERTYSEKMEHVNALYDYRQVENEKSYFEQLAIQHKAHTFVIAMIAIGLCSIIIIAFLLEHVREKSMAVRKEKETRLKDLLYAQSEQKLNENKIEMEKLGKLIAASREEMDTLKTQLLEERQHMLECDNYKILIALDRKKKTNLFESAFRATTIYRKVHMEDGKITDLDWIEFADAIDITYNDFTKRLFDLYSDISKHEMRICYLIKAGVSIKRISEILGKTISAISQSRKRLYEKIHGKSAGSKDLDNFIVEF